MRQYLARFFHVATGSHPLPFMFLIPLLLIGIGLQLQLSFFKGDGYLGLRLNAADILLPFLAIIILLRLVLRKDTLPHWRVPWLYSGLAALTVIMTIALVNGYYTTGTWNTWAIVNKYIGWFVLIAYLGLGGWVASHPAEKWLPPLRAGFLGFWAFSLIAALGPMAWFDFKGDMHNILQHYPLDGFMANRNAYAFFSFSLLAIMTAVQIKNSVKPSWGFYVLWGLMPLFYVYNASRAGLVILVFILAAFAFINIKFTVRHILPSLLAGGVLMLIFFSCFQSYALQVTQGHAENSRQLMMLEGLTAEEAQQKLDYVGDKVRMNTYTDALELWQQHPIMGGGLGAFRDYQTDKRGTYSDIIDCTGLWLLSETGVVGLTVFALFFIAGLWKLFQKIRSGEDQTGIYLGILLVMMIFAIMSLVHELLYARFLWFFMGLALAVPLHEQVLKTRQDV